MPLLLLNGLRMPSPSRMRIVHTAGGAQTRRAVDGTLVVEKTPVKCVITLEWAALHERELRLLGEMTSGTCRAEFPCPDGGGLRRLTAVRTARSQGMLYALDGEVLWRDVSIELTEV
jgi:hypothetical protein